MKPFSFIHAADLHLDSPFSALGQENPELARAMRSATFEAFDNIIDLALNRKVDFLLVAGDVYDGADRSLRAQVRFRDGLKRLSDAGIGSYVVHGNHDPLDVWSSSLEWPARVHIFRENVETVPVKRDGETLAFIQGISYPTRDERRNLSSLFRRKNPAFHIGLLHANVGSDTGHEPYAPCSLDDLMKPEMDYWALGHVHNRKILSRERPFILYPGNSQGRNIRETDERGCYLVRIKEGGEVEEEFCGTDVIRWTSMGLRINEMGTEQDLVKALDRACLDIAEKGSGRGSIARILLSGSGPLSKTLREPNSGNDLLEMARETGMSINPFVWVEQVGIRVGPELDLAAMIKKQDFMGELLRYSRELLEGEGFMESVKDDLSPLFDDPRARRFIERPGIDKLKELLEEAELECLKGLYGGDRG